VEGLVRAPIADQSFHTTVFCEVGRRSTEFRHLLNGRVTGLFDIRSGWLSTGKHMIFRSLDTISQGLVTYEDWMSLPISNTMPPSR
jgi:hypothetical protein